MGGAGWDGPVQMPELSRISWSLGRLPCPTLQTPQPCPAGHRCHAGIRCRAGVGAKGSGGAGPAVLRRLGETQHRRRQRRAFGVGTYVSPTKEAPAPPRPTPPPRMHTHKRQLQTCAERSSFVIACFCFISQLTCLPVLDMDGICPLPSLLCLPQARFSCRKKAAALACSCNLSLYLLSISTTQ